MIDVAVFVVETDKMDSRISLFRGVDELDMSMDRPDEWISTIARYTVKVTRRSRF